MFNRYFLFEKTETYIDVFFFVIKILPFHHLFYVITHILNILMHPLPSKATYGNFLPSVVQSSGYSLGQESVYLNSPRKTKIVCTIGPSTSSREMIWKLAEAGMNVARLNMSHGDHASHQKTIDLVKEYNAQFENKVIAIMLDTKVMLIICSKSAMFSVCLKYNRVIPSNEGVNNVNEVGVSLGNQGLNLRRDEKKTRRYFHLPKLW